MWENSPVSKMTTSNSPPAAHLTQLVLFHRSRCWFCFSKPIKSAWSGVSSELLEHYKHFFWSSPDVLTIPPLLPRPPLLPPFQFYFRSGDVFAEGLSGELGSFIMGRESMASGYRSEVTNPWGTRPLLRMTQSLKCIWQDIKREGYKECDSRNTEREPDRHSQWVYRLESTRSKHTAVLNIFLCNVQSLVH